MLLAILGERGSGKTLTMAKMVKEDILKGKTIYTNFHINKKAIPRKFHKNLKLIDDKFLKEYSNFKLYNCSVFLDEIYIYVDSRMSGTKRNRLFSYFVNQTRKRGVSLIYSAQLFSSVEMRLRRQTELFFFPKCVNVSGEKAFLVTVCKRQDFTDELKPVGEFRFRGSLYYDVYDTDEIISFDDETSKKG